jgi:hypothetical protein
MNLVKARKDAVVAQSRNPIPVEILAVVKASMSVVPMSSGGHVKKRPEAAFLCIIETVVERLCGGGELFQLRRARRKAFRTLLQAFDHTAMLLGFLCLFTPFRHARGARFRLFA